MQGQQSEDASRLISDHLHPTIQNLVNTCGEFDPGEVSPTPDGPGITLSLDDSLLLQDLEHLDDEERISPGPLLQSIQKCRRNLIRLQDVMDQLCDLSPAKSLQFQFAHR